MPDFDTNATRKAEKSGISANKDEREGHSGGQHVRDKAHQARTETGRKDNINPKGRQHSERKE